MTFAKFRMKLVDLIDRFFRILEKDPDYIFHLDAQTVVLEDYLEIRPENEELLKRYIASGNLQVGPWYLQNDFYLTDGESTIRNLMFGTELAEKFGKCAKTGYAPDQFGHITQIPQILGGFGIDNYIFGRGFRELERAADETQEKTCGTQEKKLPAEFEWVGADGTKCLAIHLKQWYNNAQHIPAETELAQLLLDINEKRFEGLNVSPYVLLMNGVDHLEPQADVLEVIEMLRKAGRDIQQTSLDEYISLVREAVSGKELPQYRGALNLGTDYDLLKGCWSSRIYLKSWNVRTEDLLEHKLEPLYSYLVESGFENVYPADEMRYLWKSLLKNHPHDSICGCSRDGVHRHMEDSFERISEMGEELLARGMKLACSHSGHEMGGPQNYCVTVFNPTERMLSGVVEAELNFISSESVESFALFDYNGAPAEYEIVSRREDLLDVFSPLNLPGVLDVDKTHIRFFAKDIPPFTAKTYAIVPNESGLERRPLQETALENEYYRISMESGSLQIFDKRTGRTYSDPVRVEDAADKGDAYVYRRSHSASVLVTPEFSEISAGAFSGSVAGEAVYDCPECYDFEADCRSEKTVKCTVRIAVSLMEGSDLIRVSYEIENAARDHRIRFLLSSGITEGELVTDSPFDCAVRHAKESCVETESDTHHNASFVQVSDETGAFAVFTEGQHEAERGEGVLAFTVLRATGVINRDAKTFRKAGGVCWDVPENQCLRTVSGRLGIVYGKKESGATLLWRGKEFRFGLLSHADSFDRKKYSGGRFAVQSAELEKLYYHDDCYEGKVTLPAPFFGLDSTEIAVSCCKGSAKGGTVVRFVNLSDQNVKTILTARGKIYITALSEREEHFAGEKSCRLSFSPKQIITVRLT